MLCSWGGSSGYISRANHMICFCFDRQKEQDVKQGEAKRGANNNTSHSLSTLGTTPEALAETAL